MTALDDAARAVAEARRGLHESFVLLAAPEADRARAAVARLEAAVRAHDAEIVRAMGPETMVGQYARDTIANQLDPKEVP